MKRLWSLCLAVAVMLSCVSAMVWAAEQAEAETVQEQLYEIDTPYEYPITPASPEWKTYQSRAERLAACHVDDALLQKMTTPALVETVLTYPMLPDCYAYDTLEAGMRSVSTYFSGIDELAARPDAIECLEAYAAMQGRSNDIYSMNAKYVQIYLEDEL